MSQGHTATDKPRVVPRPTRPQSLCLCAFKFGKIQRGLTNGGLKPKFSEKIGGKSSLENRAFSGQIGAISGLVGAFSGPIGTNSSVPHSHGGRAEIAPKGPFWAQLAPFGPSPPLLSPPLDFLEQLLESTHDSPSAPDPHLHSLRPPIKP